jgi:hypothetical protein
MKPQINESQNPEVRSFYGLYWPQHQILLDFFNLDSILGIGDL